MPNKRIKKLLPVVLTSAELLQISENITKAVFEIDRIENLKKNIPVLREKVLELSLKHAKGTEDRSVDCFVDLDFDAGKKTIIREDTGEIVETLPIGDEDFPELPFGGYNVKVEAGAKLPEGGSNVN